mgnify:CR=1 FL=1
MQALLVHTGQHYDQGMSHQLFEDLGLPRPDLNLEVGSGSHAVQTAEVMKRFEPVLDEHQPCGVLVVGDVMLLSLSFDHRIIDGHIGAAFAYEIIGFLEDPDRLFLEA